MEVFKARIARKATLEHIPHVGVKPTLASLPLVEPGISTIPVISPKIPGIPQIMLQDVKLDFDPAFAPNMTGSANATGSPTAPVVTPQLPVKPNFTLANLNFNFDFK